MKRRPATGVSRRHDLALDDWSASPQRPPRFCLILVSTLIAIESANHGHCAMCPSLRTNILLYACVWINNKLAHSNMNVLNVPTTDSAKKLYNLIFRPRFSDLCILAGLAEEQLFGNWWKLINSQSKIKYLNIVTITTRRHTITSFNKYIGQGGYLIILYEIKIDHVCLCWRAKQVLYQGVYLLKTQSHLKNNNNTIKLCMR